MSERKIKRAISRAMEISLKPYLRKSRNAKLGMTLREEKAFKKYKRILQENNIDCSLYY